MVESAVLGLSVITLGWIIQLVYSWSGRPEMKKRFLILQGLGIALLVIDSYVTGMIYTMTVDFIYLIIVMIILVRISPKPVRRVKTKSSVKKKRR